MRHSKRWHGDAGHRHVVKSAMTRGWCLRGDRRDSAQGRIPAPTSVGPRGGPGGAPSPARPPPRTPRGGCPGRRPAAVGHTNGGLIVGLDRVLRGQGLVRGIRSAACAVRQQRHSALAGMAMRWEASSCAHHAAPRTWRRPRAARRMCRQRPGRTSASTHGPPDPVSVGAPVVADGAGCRPCVCWEELDRAAI